MKKYSSYLEILKSEQEMFLDYLKAKFPVFHNSNFFFRDLHYGIRSYFEKKGIVLSYGDSEQLAEKYSEYLELEKIFIRITDKTWKVNLPKYVTEVPGDPL